MKKFERLKRLDGDALLDLQEHGWGRRYSWKPATILRLMNKGWLIRLHVRSATFGDSYGYLPTQALIDAIRTLPAEEWFTRKWDESKAIAALHKETNDE